MSALLSNMASFLNANLPSDDEEDDEYNPEADTTAEAGDRVKQPRKSAGESKKRRFVLYFAMPAMLLSRNSR